MVKYMQRPLTSCASLPVDSRDDSAFSVVIAYEDFETGIHARRTYDFLVCNLEDGRGFSHQMWKFDVLRIPELREIAARDAAAADLIIISCQGASDLPDSVKEWNELWLAKQGRSVGLVLLFDTARDAAKAADVSKYLAGLAQRGGIEFFSQPFFNKTPSNLSALDFNLAKQGEAGDYFPISALEPKHMPVPRWGINE
jgi:hypothetical protein